MRGSIAIQINLFVSMFWIAGTSIRTFFLSMDSSKYSVLDYLAVNWELYWLDMTLFTLFPFLFFLIILVLLISSFLKFDKLVYIGVTATFVFMAAFVLIVSILKVVPVLALVLYPLGYSCFKLIRGKGNKETPTKTSP